MTNGAFILFPRKPTENSGNLNRLTPQEPYRNCYHLQLHFLRELRSSPFERTLFISRPVEPNSSPKIATTCIAAEVVGVLVFGGDGRIRTAVQSVFI